MPPELLDPGLIETLQQTQIADLIGWEPNAGGAKNERLVALVPVAVEQIRRLRIGPGHDDARNVHDVELEARRVEPLDLLVGGHQDFSTLVAAFLCTRPLILDVVARHANLDKSPDEVPYVRLTAVARVGVGNDEGPEVMSGDRRALLISHAQALKPLVPIGGQQRPNQRCGFVGYLAEGIAGQVRTGILRVGSPGRCRPASEINTLDS